jgi:Na+-translocating ferredoxin:NAD+ oxidoreductase RnfG subunit
MMQSITPKISSDQRFVNGFESWHETHFEVVQAITIESAKKNPIGIVAETQSKQGFVGMYQLAVSLTNKFEKLNEGRQWDGEFHEEIWDFCQKELQAEN